MKRPLRSSSPNGYLSPILPLSHSTRCPHFWNTPRDGHSIITLGRLFQCPIILSEKKFFLISNLICLYLVQQCNISAQKNPSCALFMLSKLNIMTTKYILMVYFHCCSMKYHKSINNCQSKSRITTYEITSKASPRAGLAWATTWLFMMAWLWQWTREEPLISPIYVSVMPLTLSSIISLSPNWKDLDLMGV